MGLLDDAIREHLELKRRRGADAGDISREESEALGPVRRGPDGAPDISDTFVADQAAGEAPPASPSWESDETAILGSAPAAHDPPTAGSYEPPSAPAHEPPSAGYGSPAARSYEPTSSTPAYEPPPSPPAYEPPTTAHEPPSTPPPASPPEAERPWFQAKRSHDDPEHDPFEHDAFAPDPERSLEPEQEPEH
ncbi:MAG: hypothetical protein M3376_13885, partial [Actinomycetota bacterium]|nr:hypothetical protein [Actinomycetota bacterium]